MELNDEIEELDEKADKRRKKSADDYHTEGRKAFENKELPDTCPYLDVESEENKDRIGWWLDGWSGGFGEMIQDQIDNLDKVVDKARDELDQWLP